MNHLKFLLFAVLLLAGFSAAAQQPDLMRSNGRIYVVVAVMVAILIGLLLYLARLDRRIRRLEKDSEQGN